MAFHVRDKQTDALVRELARRKQIGLTEAVRMAVGAELKRLGDERPLRRRLHDIADEIAAYPDTGAKADKTFFDELSGI
jgi:antitoxin VapB